MLEDRQQTIAQARRQLRQHVIWYGQAGKGPCQPKRPVTAGFAARASCYVDKRVPRKRAGAVERSKIAKDIEPTVHEAVRPCEVNACMDSMDVGFRYAD